MRSTNRPAEEKAERRTGRSMSRSARRADAAEPVELKENQFAKIFAAMGEPTRLRIMQILPREPICDQMYNVVELADEVGLTQPTVSHHLKILSDAGLVSCRRECNSLYFYVNTPVMEEWLREIRTRFGCII